MVCGAADLHPDFEGLLAGVSSMELGSVGGGEGGASKRGGGGRNGGMQGSENKRYDRFQTNNTAIKNSAGRWLSGDAFLMFNASSVLSYTSRFQNLVYQMTCSVKSPTTKNVHGSGHRSPRRGCKVLRLTRNGQFLAAVATSQVVVGLVEKGNAVSPCH